MSGKDKLEKTAKKIKEEVKADKQKVIKVENTLAAVAKNENLSDKYALHANLGMESVGGALPTLKIHYANQSKNELADGSEPNNGWFFHKTIQEQFEQIEAHILLISRGYYSRDMNDTKDVFTQIMAGVMVEDNIPTNPFVMFMKGILLNPMWEWAKSIRTYTKGKQPVPMMSMRVRLTTEQEKTDQGNKVWRVNFTTIRHEDGSPVVLADEGQFEYLIGLYQRMNETINSLIENKGNEEHISEGEPPHPADDIDEVL